jgi:DNA-binding transcriptional ArsR family regulator
MSKRDDVLAALKDGSHTTSQLVEVTGMREESLRSLCEMLESKGMVAKDGDTWSIPAPTDPHRGKILAFLADGPKSVGEVAEHLGVDRMVALKALRRARTAGEAETNGWARAARWSLALVKRKAKAPAKAAKPAKAPRAKAQPKPKKTPRQKVRVDVDVIAHAKTATGDPILAAIDAEIARAFARLETLKSARDLVAGG